jgi:glycosyltransferase involved in cell wall biosynthesis
MGIPTKVLEYMALNVPVLCNDNPYQEQAVNESGAGLCVSLTAENFAEALLELLENTAQRKRMATLGRQYITEFWNYEKLAADVFAAYQNLLKRSSI